MTITEMRKSTKLMLTPADIAPILGCDQNTIRQSAKQRPDGIRFPFTFIGNRMKIPREGFLKWIDGEVNV